MWGSSAANEGENTTGPRGQASTGYFHRSLKSSSVGVRNATFGKAGGLLPLLDVGVEQEAESFQDEKVGSMA